MEILCKQIGIRISLTSLRTDKTLLERDRKCQKFLLSGLKINLNLRR